MTATSENREAVLDELCKAIAHIEDALPHLRVAYRGMADLWVSASLLAELEAIGKRLRVAANSVDVALGRQTPEELARRALAATPLPAQPWPGCIRPEARQ